MKNGKPALNSERRNFTPTRIPILKISSKSDIYALDTPGRKLDPTARESVLSGIWSLPRADLLEVLNTLFLSLGDDIARIPALNNFVIAKVEEKVQQNTNNEPSGKRVKKEQFPSLPPTKGNPLQSSITVQRKRSCRSVGVQDIESCRTYNVDVSNKFESIANVDDTDMRMDENYSPGADPSLQCMPGPSHEEIQIPYQKPRESKIINNNGEQIDNNEDQRHMQEARKHQVSPITVRDKKQLGRKYCLSISGLPEQNKENILEITLDFLYGKLNVPCSHPDIDDIFRIGKPYARTGHRSVLVCFVTNMMKNRVFQAKKSLKNIFEDLSKSNYELFQLAQRKHGRKNVCQWEARCSLS
ncbi:hypothetical protein JTB14_036230 [Gonioctena quinquepunctata]|nr:hypothetical protein JTB14_036230 [Gonioctena quinquepunctata]